MNWEADSMERKSMRAHFLRLFTIYSNAVCSLESPVGICYSLQIEFTYYPYHWLTVQEVFMLDNRTEGQM